MKKPLLFLALLALCSGVMGETQTATWRTQDWAAGKTTITENSLPGLGASNVVTLNGVTFSAGMELIKDASLFGSGSSSWWGWTAYRALNNRYLELFADDGWCIREVTVSCCAYDAANNPAEFKLDCYDKQLNGYVLAGGIFDLTCSDIGTETPCSITTIPAGTHFAKIYNTSTFSTHQHWIYAVTVVIEREEAPVGPVERYFEFNDGTYYLGTAGLNLGTLHGNRPAGTVTYTVKDANGTGAAVSGFYLTATTPGTAVVTATQAAVEGVYTAKSVDAVITVANVAYAQSIDFAELAAAAPDIATTLADNHYTMSSLNSVSWDSQGYDKPDTGLKTESGDKDFSFFVPAEGEVTITLGNWQGGNGTAELYANGAWVADLAGNTVNGPYSADGITQFVIKIVNPFWSVLKKIDIVAPEDQTALSATRANAVVRKVIRANRVYIVRDNRMIDLLGNRIK
ncbi:MAG: hypothetical protein MJZ75_07330 [Paludibacteraceae bacterium]|nr:hypothetical protein [Paludibacteraceae bacterium]